MSRIMIVDDEEAIREIMTLFLKRDGHDITAISSGSEAVKNFKSNINSGTPFDLVILDANIPGDIGAIEIIESIKKHDPDISAVITSGDSVGGAMKKPEEFGFAKALKKPFKSADLLNLVKNLINN